MSQDTSTHRSRSKDRKHSSPSRTPVGDVPAGGVPIQCQYCSGQLFRRSRLRSEDLRQILLMRYPVRCLRCSQRQMVSFTVAGMSLSSHTKHERPVRPQDTWKHWTERSDDSSAFHTVPPRPDE